MAQTAVWRKHCRKQTHRNHQRESPTIGPNARPNGLPPDAPRHQNTQGRLTTDPLVPRGHQPVHLTHPVHRRTLRVPPRYLSLEAAPSSCRPESCLTTHAASLGSSPSLPQSVMTGTSRRELSVKSEHHWTRPCRQSSAHCKCHRQLMGSGMERMRTGACSRAQLGIALSNYQGITHATVAAPHVYRQPTSCGHRSDVANVIRPSQRARKDLDDSS